MEIKVHKSKLITFKKVLLTPRGAFRKLGIDIYSGKLPYCSFLLLYTVLHLLGMMLTMYLFVVDSVNSGQNRLKAVSSLLLLVTELSCLIKIGVTFKNRSEITTIFQKLELRFPDTVEEQEKCETGNYSSDLKLIKSLTFFSLSCILALGIMPLILIPYIYFTKGVFVYILPMDAKFPFGITSIYVYIFCYFYQLIGGIITTYAYICFEMMIEVMVILLCVQFDALLLEIEKLEEKIWKMDPKDCFKIKPKVLLVNELDIFEFDPQEQLSLIVDRHQEIIEVVNDINKLFGPMLLYIFVNDTAIICLNFFTSLVGSTVILFYQFT